MRLLKLYENCKLLYNKNMKILITSGGTSEPIDRVRSITNHSTGQLGKIIAETFLKANTPVTLVTTKQAAKPQPHPLLRIIEISNVAGLEVCLEPLVKEHDVLIHSMAVSDYTPLYMTGLEEIEQTNNIYDLLHKSNTENKISSQSDYQALFLKKTPKIISKIKQWNPAIQLIGFKLLVDVAKEELIAVARKSLVENKADYIIANDLRDISSDGHKAFLIGKDTNQMASTKQEIAQLVLTACLGKKEMTMTRITLAITGSISAYKAADLSNQLTQLGYQVTVLMSQAATQFISPLTLQSLTKNRVYTEVMQEENPLFINHIDIAKKTDLFLVAPLSANTLAKLASGMADNIVTAVALALPPNVPKLIAPAMNTNMYLNPASQHNLKLLRSYGFEEIKPRKSLLACGDIGVGALATIETIIGEIQQRCSTRSNLNTKSAWTVSSE